MTQKELLYIEDAIGHESNIIGICNEMLDLLEDEYLCSFITKELKKHENTKEDLLNLLEVKCNE
jgi:hypothetical protein